MKNRENLIPDVLDIRYTIQNQSKSIKLINNQFLIKNPNPELINIKEISDGKWVKFWDSIERISIWDLEEEYQSCSLKSGFKWNIEIEYQNRTIKSYGVNIEPKIYIGNKIVSILEELYKSLEELIY